MHSEYWKTRFIYALHISTYPVFKSLIYNLASNLSLVIWTISACFIQLAIIWKCQWLKRHAITHNNLSYPSLKLNWAMGSKGFYSLAFPSTTGKHGVLSWSPDNRIALACEAGVYVLVIKTSPTDFTSSFVIHKEYIPASKVVQL